MKEKKEAEREASGKTKKGKTKRLSILQTALILATLLVFFLNSIFIFNLGQGIENTDTLFQESEKGLGEAAEKIILAAKKPELSLISLTDASCNDCFDLGQLIETVKSLDANIVEETEINYTSGRARELIERYEIERIPALIILGDTQGIPSFTENWKSIGSIEDDNSLVLRNISPVFLDLKSGEYRGRVKIVKLVDGNCSECSQPISGAQLKSVGIIVSGEETVEWRSPKGEELIREYAIERIPTTILSEEIRAYTALTKSLEALGTFEPNGSFVFREIAPLYLDLNSGKVVGKTAITYLIDKECSECYDANIHRQILERNFGLVIERESTIEISSSEGQKLLSDYNITSIPTVIVSGDVEAYSALKAVWPQIGSIEEDGRYVFRKLNALGSIKYKNLLTGELVDTGAS